MEQGSAQVRETEMARSSCNPNEYESRGLGLYAVACSTQSGCVLVAYCAWVVGRLSFGARQPEPAHGMDSVEGYGTRAQLRRERQVLRSSALRAGRGDSGPRILVGRAGALQRHWRYAGQRHCFHLPGTEAVSMSVDLAPHVFAVARAASETKRMAPFCVALRVGCAAAAAVLLLCWWNQSE